VRKHEHSTGEKVCHALLDVRNDDRFACSRGGYDELLVATCQVLVVNCV
jgi:hypothetical protein